MWSKRYSGRPGFLIDLEKIKLSKNIDFVIDSNNFQYLLTAAHCVDNDAGQVGTWVFNNIEVITDV